jgi:hypothetical protein
MVDEHHGKGGTYEVNPKSGKRTLVDGSRTEPQPTQAELEAETAPAAAPPKAPEPAPEPTSKP